MSGKSKLTLFLEMKDKLFNNKLSQVKKKFDKATGAMYNRTKWLGSKTSMAFKSMAADVPLFGRAIELLGNPYTLIAAGLFSVVSLFGKAKSEAKAFNSEFLHIRQLNLDKQNADLKTYKGLIRDSAFETGKSLTETTKAYYDLQSALGVYGKDARIIFTEVANYSTATGANLTDAVNSTSKAFKAFNLQGKDTRQLLIANAKAVQLGMTTFDELAKVQTDFAGSAGNIGQTVATANKIFGVFTSIAKSSAEAATLTKTFFQGLAQRSKQIEKHLNIKVFDEKGNFKQADTILKQIGSRFKNLSQSQVADLITKIGGPDGLNQLLLKMKGNASDVINTFTGFDNVKFDLTKALKNAQGDVTVLGEIVKNRFNVVMATLGEKILPLVATFLDKLNKTLNWTYQNFGLLNDIVTSLGAGIATYLGIWAAFKVAMIASSIAAGGLTGALGAVKFALFAIRFALYQIPIVGWIAAAVTALVLLYKRWDAFRATIKGFGEVFKVFFENIKMGFGKIINSIVDRFNAVKKIIKGIVSFDFSAVKEGTKDYAKAVVKSFDGVTDVLPVAGAIKHGTEYRKAFSKGFHKEMELSKKSGKTTSSSNSLIPKAVTSTNTNVTGSELVAQDISSTTSKASQPRSIVVNIEALNKGGINTQHTTLAHKSAEELEEWFNEMMLRIIRNTELSYE